MTRLLNEIFRIIRAFGHALDGIASTWRTEAAFRTEVVCAAVMAPLAFIVTTDTGQRTLLLGSLFLVLIVELLNTGIEAVVDRISRDHHELSKKAKDAGSAAVLISLFNAGVIWITTLMDHLWI